MGFAYGAGSRTLPKAGKLGSGAYYKSTGHHASLNGNVFGPNWQKPQATTPGAPSIGEPFGKPVQALISTTATGRAPNSAVTQQFPLATQHNRATVTKLSTLTHAATVGVSPITIATRVSPNEQTTFVHGRVRIVRKPYRTTGGVNNSMPSDTAFHRIPPRTQAKANPSANVDMSKQVARGGNASFMVGANSGTLTGHANNDSGASRWTTIKKGAAG